jgi:hypothetical protein
VTGSTTRCAPVGSVMAALPRRLTLPGLAPVDVAWCRGQRSQPIRKLS